MIDAARRRILAAADPAAARLVQIALNKRTKHPDALAAIRELLNRAGVLPVLKAEEPGSSGNEDGSQVLWEEFVSIHRRAVAK